jgi:hypothetical protein
VCDNARAACTEMSKCRQGAGVRTLSQGHLQGQSRKTMRKLSGQCFTCVLPFDPDFTDKKLRLGEDRELGRPSHA